MSTIAERPPHLPTNHGLRELITPHRSYRRLPVSRAGALMTIPAALLCEAAVLFFAQRALNAMSAFASFVAGHEGVATRSFTDPFLFFSLQPMTFAMRHSDWIELCVVMAVGLVAIVVLSVWTTIAAPIRFFINVNLLLIVGAALYLLFAGRLGYDSAAFSELMLRTALLTWLIIPLFVGLLSSLFPFTLVERFLFIAITVAYDIPLSIVRYGLFVAILGKASSIVMADLYLVFGPLLDAIPIICFFSLFLARVARSLEARRSVWGWL